jgi:hypothetical protein
VKRTHARTISKLHSSLARSRKEEERLRNLLETSRSAHVNASSGLELLKLAQRIRDDVKQLRELETQHSFVAN